MAAVAVPRALDAPRRLHRRQLVRAVRAADCRQGDAHADDAAPRQRGRLPRLRRDLSRAPDRGAPAAARRLGGGARTSRATGNVSRVRCGAAAIAARAPRAARRPKLRIEERAPWLVWYGLSPPRRARQRALVVRLARAHGRGHVRSRTSVARRRRRRGRRRRRKPRASATWPASGPRPAPDIAQWTGLRASSRRPADSLRLDRTARSATSTSASSTTSRARRFRRRTFALAADSSHVSTTSCSSHEDRRRVAADEHRAAVIQGGEVSRDVPRGRHRRRTGRSRTAACGSSPSPRCHASRDASSRTRPRGSRHSSTSTARPDELAPPRRAPRRARLHAPAVRRGARSRDDRGRGRGRASRSSTPPGRTRATRRSLAQALRGSPKRAW